jgi:large subunit ribosomal protein L1
LSKLNKVASILGPKKLMPSIKTGTVTSDFNTTIKELIKGKTIYYPDKFGNINVSIGRISFSDDELFSNYETMIRNIISNRFVKSERFKKVALSTTMSPSIIIK